MGKTVRNPVTGHRITFLQTAEQTGGELLQIMYAVERPEAKPAIPLHIHLQCEERFEVVDGRLGIIVDGERRILQAGEQVLIPPGTPHTFWNAGDAELRFITDVRPPGQLQTYWETVFGLAEDGKVNKNGLPNLYSWRSSARWPIATLPTSPSRLLNSSSNYWGGIGRLLGYKESYPQYSQPTV